VETCLTRRDRWLGRVAGLALRALARTWRITWRGPDPLAAARRPAEIGAFWHRDVLLIAALFRDRGFGAPVSRSRDGERIAAVLRALGFAPPARGSSSRGGAAALRGLVRSVRGGTTVAVPVDGPRGPAGEPKTGVLALARVAGVPVTPLAAAARPAWGFSSWDRTVLPAPFARVVLRFGPPLPVPAELSEDEEEALRRRLAAELDAVASRAAADLDERGGAS